MFSHVFLCFTCVLFLYFRVFSCVFVFSNIFLLFYIQNAFANDDDHHMTIQIIGRQRCSLNSPLMLHDIYMEDIAITICNPVDVRVLDEEVLSKQIIKFPESSINRLKENERYKFLASLTPHTTFIYNYSSTENFIKRLVNWLSVWFKRSQIDLIINQGMTVFSFWVASNIPMSLDSKLLLLEENSTDRRLRMEWRIISQMTRIVCLACHDFKCSINDVINLSVDANSAHFVNQGGFVHDLFTVGTIKNVDFQGEPSPEFCWFSGYEWTVMECSECGTHIGWRFTTSSKDLTPSQFFGISRRSFKLAYQKEEE
uniref:CULT domain-containing protein n=1 Tax=Meloidogyne enterolobii TaxID=390850 RepID=A0A6V7U9Q9_MELEN|nr:unnamed protein product [Meloidogyne enterolobii]